MNWPKLEKMKWEDLITYCSWKVMEDMTNGNGIRHAMVNVFNTTEAWRKIRDTKSGPKPKKEKT